MIEFSSIALLNNPSLQAFMFATLAGYKVEWPTGADKMLLVSLGTGSRDPQVSPMAIEAGNALKSLVSLMDDCAALVETMLQWMSTSPTARSIDSDMGDLKDDLIAKKSRLVSRINQSETSKTTAKNKEILHIS